MSLEALTGWLDRRVDFGVMEVAEGKRSDAIRDDVALHKAADERLHELQDRFLTDDDFFSGSQRI